MDRPRPRDPTLDVARALAMGFVVYAHATQLFFASRADHLFNAAAFAIWRGIYGFHVAAFYLIAGLARGDLRAKPGGKILGEMAALLGFTYVAQIASWGAQDLVAGAFGQPTDITLLSRPLVQGHDFFIVVIWFLMSLAWVQGAAYVLIGKFSRLLKLAVILAVIALNLTLTGPTNVLMLRTVAPGLLFFLIGQYLGRTDLRPPAWWWLALFPLAVLLAPLNHGCLLEATTTCPDGYGRSFVTMLVNGRPGFLPLFLVTGLAGSFAILSLAKLLRKIRPLAWCGRHTIELLVANGITLSMLQPHFINRLPAFPPAGGIILIPLALTLIQFGLLPVYAAPLGWAYRTLQKWLVGLATSRFPYAEP